MSQKTFGPLGNSHYDEYVDLIHQSGRRLVSMVNDILDLSRIESGEYTLNLEQVDLRELIGAACKRCAPPLTGATNCLPPMSSACLTG
jgi:two-component system cell cycle sensor histidine kinase PleC